MSRGFGVVNFTIQTIWKKGTKIIRAFEQNGWKMRRFRNPERSDFEEALLKWFYGTEKWQCTGEWPSAHNNFILPKFLYLRLMNFLASTCMEYTEYIGIYYYMKRQIIHVTGPRCSGSSRNLRFPDYVTVAQDDCKVVSLTHRPPLPPGNAPGTNFYLRLSRPQGHSAIGRIISTKNSNDTIWNQTRYLPICSTAP